MKEILMNILKKYRKIVILIGIGILLIIVGNISWDVYFSKIKIFKENEKKFYETVEHYYEFHKQQLPRKGEARTLTLQDLYSKKLIDDLYIPKTAKTCDVNLSRVRVYQDTEGNYIYNTYLKCGRYESKVDHKGPEITLNGEDSIMLAVNDEYKELGIKEAKDDKDGSIDINKVKIDTSELKMNKIGNYKVKYIAYDSSFNKTIVERNVYVRGNLTEEIRKNVDASGYYKGSVNNNYILFSGILFRIVNVNSDGTIKIITDQNVSNTTYSKTGVDYNESNVKEWLNNMFYKNLKNTKKYVVEDSKWCLDEACTNVVTDKVGMLTINDLNAGLVEEMSYLNNYTSYAFMNKNGDNVYLYDPFEGVTEVPSTTLVGIRPVINLKANLYVIAGTGSFDRPYKIGDYKDAKKNDLLNTRLVGEYVNYSGMQFRISGFDKDKNIKLTSVGYVVNSKDDMNFVLSYDNDDKVMLFNPKQSENIGYQLNNDILEYIDESLIVPHEVKIYQYDENLKYTDYKQKKKYKVKISIPASFDLFSGTDNTFSSFTRYWLIDYVDNDNAFMINGANGKTFKVSQEKYGRNALRIVIYVSKDAKITKGNGTAYNQFYIK